MDTSSARGRFLTASARVGAKLVVMALALGVLASSESFAQKKKKKPEDKGAPQIALALHGLVDPPSLYTYRVEFQPAKKRALVHLEKAEEEGKPHRKWTDIWTLADGLFKSRDDDGL